MKRLLMSLVFTVACASNTSGDCVSDSCQCPTTSACSHTCSPGGVACNIQCAFDQPCDVVCDAAESCDVQGGTSPRVDVDCAGTADCRVQCPETGCTVTNCNGAGCIVSCGGSRAATHSGSTATCP